jgi:hypothetical protein
MLSIPNEVQNCVAFIGYDTSAGNLKLLGSCFFIEYHLEDEIFQYLVTAGHLLDEIRGNGIAETQIRINLKSGIAASVAIPIDTWLRPPNSDIAITPVRLADVHDHSAIVPALWIEDAAENSNRPNVGNELFIPGLFWPHHGRTKNIPIMRVGSISALPGEEFQFRQISLTGYLIECRSIGGVIGSPVFRQTSGFDGMALILSTPGFQFLGLVQDHFDLENDPNRAPYDERGKINLGLGIVIPSNQIINSIKQVSELIKLNRKQVPPG